MTTISFEGPIAGEPFLMAGSFDLAADGYRREEWIAGGDARSFAAVGTRGLPPVVRPGGRPQLGRNDPGPRAGRSRSFAAVGARGTDGRWQARPDAEAGFTTRVVVVRPDDPGRYCGTLVVEWMNVTGGLDAAPDWLFLHRHLVREGAAWVGVSVQKAGIDGGGLVPGRPLKEATWRRAA